MDFPSGSSHSRGRDKILPQFDCVARKKYQILVSKAADPGFGANAGKRPALLVFATSFAPVWAAKLFGETQLYPSRRSFVSTDPAKTG